MTEKASFKAKIIALPEIEVENEQTKEKSMRPLGKFTVGKFYRVYAVFDSGLGRTDFLVGDNEGIFHWLNIGIFRSK